MSSNSFNFDPFNKEHAIVEMVTFFEFFPELSNVAPAFTAIIENLKEKFPRSQPTQLFKFEIGDQSTASFSPTPGGLQLMRPRTDGSPEWVINITLTNLSFHCLNYSRWDEVWPEMQEYIATVFKTLASLSSASASIVTGMGLKYVDRFNWQSAGAAYDIRQLFNKDGNLLNRIAFSSGHRWHCHTGWFKDTNNLNQLNVDSGEQPVSGQTQIIVNIEHTQALRDPSAYQDSIVQFAQSITNGGAVDGLMNRYHDENRAVLIELLTAAAQDRVGLNKKPRA